MNFSTYDYDFWQITGNRIAGQREYKLYNYQLTTLAFFPAYISSFESTHLIIKIGGGEKEGVISEQQTTVKATLQEVYHSHYTTSLLLGVCSISIYIRVRVKGRHTWFPETRCHPGRKTAFR